MLIRRFFIVFILFNIFSLDLLYAQSVRDIMEIECEYCYENSGGGRIAPADHYSPLWNKSGTMLSFIEISSAGRGTLIVVEIDSRDGHVRWKEVFRFPSGKEDEPPVDDDSMPSYSSEVSGRTGAVEMVNWSPEENNLILFQYGNRLYYAYIGSDSTPVSFDLKKSYREYPKWSIHGDNIVFGKNGDIFTAGIGDREKLFGAIRKSPGFRDSNPGYYRSLTQILFERYDDRLNCGIALQQKDAKPVSLLDHPVSTEMMPNLSPGGSYLAFISNQWDLTGSSRISGNNNERPIDFYERSDWRIYAVEIEQTINSNTLPLPANRWIQVSENNAVQLNFRHGMPNISWVDDRRLLYIEKHNSTGIFLSTIRTEASSQLIPIPPNAGESTILTINEIAYSPATGRIALSCFRRGNEYFKKRSGMLLYGSHNRIFVGKVSGF